MGVYKWVQGLASQEGEGPGGQRVQGLTELPPAVGSISWAMQLPSIRKFILYNHPEAEIFFKIVSYDPLFFSLARFCPSQSTSHLMLVILPHQVKKNLENALVPLSVPHLSLGSCVRAPHPPFLSSKAF